LIVALGVFELFNFSHHPRSAHPTLSSMADTLLGPHVVRAGAFAGWLIACATIAAL
jgi:hypothetical protein